MEKETKQPCIWNSRTSFAIHCKLLWDSNNNRGPFTSESICTKLIERLLTERFSDFPISTERYLRPLRSELNKFDENVGTEK